MGKIVSRAGKFARSLGRWAFTLGVLGVLAWFAWPYLDDAWFAFDLARAEPPAVLPVPVEGVPPTLLTDTWGAARSGGRSHEGIDIFAPRGTNVLSATRGVVVRRGNNSLGGRIVTVMGPGSEFHYYAHMDDWGAVEVGDRVAIGTVLGIVGDTGNAKGTPPHLHYGIYPRGGGAVNPYPRLTAAP